MFVYVCVCVCVDVGTNILLKRGRLVSIPPSPPLPSTKHGGSLNSLVLHSPCSQPPVAASTAGNDASDCCCYHNPGEWVYECMTTSNCNGHGDTCEDEINCDGGSCPAGKLDQAARHFTVHCFVQQCTKGRSILSRSTENGPAFPSLPPLPWLSRACPDAIWSSCAASRGQPPAAGGGSMRTGKVVGVGSDGAVKLAWAIPSTGIGYCVPAGLRAPTPAELKAAEAAAV